jgi:serine/threonine protein kinase
MTPERWVQVNEVLHRAMQIAPEKQPSFLDGACGSDESLRREVESLLAADDEARSNFLQSPPAVGLGKVVRIQDYEIQSLLGAGGMGEVYRARDLRLRRDVAIKVLPALVSADPGRLHRFEQEAMAAAALNHPNILVVYQMGTYEGAPYLVSELLEGETLREQIRRGRLGLRKAIEYAIQMARGLAAAHEKGIVHRDLKPENLFVTKDGRVKILDFGLAKLVQPRSSSQHSALTVGSETEAGIVMGTIGYMSPEQVRGEAADHRADIFAFGAILYEMLTRQRAFQKPTSAETMAAILNEEPPATSQTTLQIPPALQRVVRRCLEKSPEQRFQSTSDLAFALEALSDSGTSLTSTLDLRGLPRTKWILSGVTLVTSILLLVLIWQRSLSTAIPQVESVTQLTSDGEPKVASSLQTDGSRLFFNEGIPGSLRIAQVSVTGGQTAPVPTSVINPQILAIEQNGSELLLVDGNLSAGPAPRGHLWSLPLPAGAPRRLGDLDAHNATLFPDGRVLYTRDSAVYIAAEDGSGSHKLTEIAHYLTSFPAVSPDGERVAFGSSDPAATRWGPIFEIKAADGTSTRTLLREGEGNLPSVICCPTWTPDGEYMLFRGGTPAMWDLWAVSEGKGFLHGAGAPARLTSGPLSYGRPTFSRDGKQIFVVGTQRRGELVRYDAGLHEFVRYLGGVSAINPTFSKDGKWVAYVAFPDATLWLSRTDGGDRVQLTYSPTVVTFPQISPDGSKVAFTDTEGVAYVVAAEEKTPRKITDNAWGPTWSADANLVTFVSIIPGKSQDDKDSVQTKIADLRNGNVSVVPGSLGISAPQFVGQDTLVATTQDQAKVILFNFKTQKWSELAAKAEKFVDLQVSPNRQYVYCTTGGNNPEVLRIKFANHAIAAIAPLKDLHRVDDPWSGTYVSVAPDGSPIVTRDTGTQEVYALKVKWR